MPGTPPIGQAPPDARRSRASAPARRAIPWTTWVVVAVVLAAAVAAGTLIWSRIVRVQQGAIVPQVPQGVRHDPATRARGAVISISGRESRPVATYDPPSGTVTVRFQSKYYDPTHTAQLNREYLATEGRLVVQLVLYNDPDTPHVAAELYHGRQHLATVSGTPGQDYAGYSVQYAPGLP